MERRKPFWLEGITDLAQLMTYTLQNVESQAALQETEDALKKVMQVTYEEITSAKILL